MGLFRPLPQSVTEGRRDGAMSVDSGLDFRRPVFVSVKIDSSECEIELSYYRASESPLTRPQNPSLLAPVADWVI